MGGLVRIKVVVNVCALTPLPHWQKTSEHNKITLFYPLADEKEWSELLSLHAVHIGARNITMHSVDFI